MHQSMIEDSVIAFLRTRCVGAASALVDQSTPLLNSEILDSIGILELMMFLAERFDVEVEDLDFHPANFETVSHLAAFVSQKKTAYP
jgi:acyl carrier protein